MNFVLCYFFLRCCFFFFLFTMLLAFVCCTVFCWVFVSVAMTGTVGRHTHTHKYLWREQNRHAFAYHIKMNEHKEQKATKKKKLHKMIPHFSPHFNVQWQQQQHHRRRLHHHLYHHYHHCCFTAQKHQQ